MKLEIVENMSHDKSCEVSWAMHFKRMGKIERANMLSIGIAAGVYLIAETPYEFACETHVKLNVSFFPEMYFTPQELLDALNKMIVYLNSPCEEQQNRLNCQRERREWRRMIQNSLEASETLLKYI